MKIQSALLALAATVDRFTNRLSVFNVLENLVVESFPVFIPEMVFIALVRRETGDANAYDGTVAIRLGDSKIGEQKIRVDFENTSFNRQLITFRGIPISKPASMFFELSIPPLAPAILEVPVTKTEK